MSRRAFMPGAFRLAGTAAVGVLAGHFVGYRIVFPGSPQRHAILIETGHGYFPVALRLAAMVAVVLGAAALAGGYARARSRGLPAPSVAVTTSRLALLQLTAFAGLEFFERLVSGVPFHHFLLPVLLVGAAAQIAIASVGAMLIRALYRLGERVARAALPEAAASEPTIWAPSRVVLTPASHHGRREPIRGPPQRFLVHAG